MKKFIICLFILFGCLLIPNTRVFADGVSQDYQDEFYIYPQLPDVVYFYDEYQQTQYIIQHPNYFTLDVNNNTHYISVGGGISFTQGIELYVTQGYLTSNFVFSECTSVELIWYDFYYPREEFWINFDLDGYYWEADVSIDYFNSVGGISNTSFTHYSTSQTPIDWEAISAVHEINGIMHIANMSIILTEAVNGSPFSELTILSYGDSVLSDNKSVFADWVRMYNQDEEINVGSWLLDSLNSFLSFELVPNFSLATLLSLIVCIPLLLWILKLFLGG